jgi:hypothetical protein
MFFFLMFVLCTVCHSVDFSGRLEGTQQIVVSYGARLGMFRRAA